MTPAQTLDLMTEPEEVEKEARWAKMTDDAKAVAQKYGYVPKSITGANIN